MSKIFVKNFLIITFPISLCVIKILSKSHERYFLKNFWLFGRLGYTKLGHFSEQPEITFLIQTYRTPH